MHSMETGGGDSYRLVITSVRTLFDALQVILYSALLNSKGSHVREALAWVGGSWMHDVLNRKEWTQITQKWVV